MPWLMQSPMVTPDASQTQRGLVNTVAQTFAGAKTFLATIVASAGVQLASLFNTNGGASSDVVLKIGTTVANASVHASAKLLSVRTGLGGTEVDHVWVKKAVGSNSVINVDLQNAGPIGLDLLNVPLGASGINQTLAAGGSLRIGNSGGYASLGLEATNRSMMFIANGTAYDGSAQAFYFRNQGATSRVAMRIDGTATQTANWLEFGASGAAVGFVSALGTLGWGAIPNATGTPGAATQNSPKGRAAIAAGATSVVITNSEITANSVVHPIWEADPGARWWVTVAAGSFTLSVNAAPAGAVNFRWVAFK